MYEAVVAKRLFCLSGMGLAPTLFFNDPSSNPTT